MSQSQADMKIIVIDDNPSIHNDFIKILRAQPKQDESNDIDEITEGLFGPSDKRHLNDVEFPKFQIDTASQGQEGVQRIQEAINSEKPYSLAFVDIRMPPGWDGVETIKHIWELDPDIQTVICTAYSDYTWEETIKELGMNDNLLIMKKPFDNVATRQLACALTKKWMLMHQARMQTEELEERVKDRTQALEKALSLTQATLESTVQLEEKLAHQANHDSLTGLPNRILLHDRLKQAISTSKRDDSLVGVFFFDLDRFKFINDSLSHEAGDELLKAVAQRIRSLIREEDTLARLGGDEFVMVLPKLKTKQDAIRIANLLTMRMREPFVIANREIVVTTSIGIALYPQDGENINQLLRHADLAMYSAKDDGGNRFQFYNPSLNEGAVEYLEMEVGLRNAMSNKELFINYQPYINTKSGNVVAIEALPCWRHPSKGLILPMDFMPFAERSGFVIDIGKWCLREACLQNKRWQDKGLRPVRVVISVSAQQIKQPDFLDSVAEILNQTRLKAEFVEMVLPENVIHHNEAAFSTVKRLKELGVQISLGDFGTKNSSFNCMATIPVDRLRIDKSFVSNIETNRNDAVIIRAIIAMANSLNLDVVAEGVETQAQARFLHEEKCKEYQGFYYSKPLAAEALEKLLVRGPMQS